MGRHQDKVGDFRFYLACILLLFTYWKNIFLSFVRFNMEQDAFADFVQGMISKLWNVACLVMNTLRGESFLKKHTATSA